MSSSRTSVPPRRSASSAPSPARAAGWGRSARVSAPASAPLRRSPAWASRLRALSPWRRAPAARAAATCLWPPHPSRSAPPSRRPSRQSPPYRASSPGPSAHASRRGPGSPLRRGGRVPSCRAARGTDWPPAFPLPFRSRTASGRCTARAPATRRAFPARRRTAPASCGSFPCTFRRAVGPRRSPSGRVRRP